MTDLASHLDRWRAAADTHAAAFSAQGRREEVGRITALADGIALVAGLPGVALQEVVLLGEGADAELGVAVDLGPDRVACVLLGTGEVLAAGMPVARTGETLAVPVGDGLWGRVLDPLGRPLDEEPAPVAQARRGIEQPAPTLGQRAPVSRPLLTGTLAVDSMLPLGRGQRELLIGDRATGKTTLALDAILSQRHTDVRAIYVAIGQQAAATARTITLLRTAAAWERVLVVAATADDPLGLQWIAPAAATAMAEWEAAHGRDVLLIYDDLTTHAIIHRQLSLLMRRPAGREAYPGDIFYLHARLLERAAQLAPAAGGGSITALPIAETQAGNLAAYIPTNLISITDGQIVLDGRLFAAGVRPAVDIGVSVSRIGAKAQLRPLRPFAERMRLAFAQFLELETFTRFGEDMDADARARIAQGRTTRQLLRQAPHAPLDGPAQIAALLALSEGLLRRAAVPASAWHQRLRDAAARLPELAQALEAPLSPTLAARLAEVLVQGLACAPDTPAAAQAGSSG